MDLEEETTATTTSPSEEQKATEEPAVSKADEEEEDDYSDEEEETTTQEKPAVVGKKRSRDDEEEKETAVRPSKYVKSSGKSNRVPVTQRCELQFEVSRVDRLVREAVTSKRVSVYASMAITAAVEYIMAEVMELAGSETTNGGRKRITAQDVMMAVRRDDELRSLFPNAVWTGAGTVPLPPKIQASLYPKSSVIHKRSKGLAPPKASAGKH